MSRTVKDSMNPLTWEYRLHGSCFSQMRDPGGNGREAHSLKYEDNEYEYKDVTLTKKQYDVYREQLKKNPRKFIDEDYMYNVLQLQQTPGWEQYYIYPIAEDEMKKAVPTGESLAAADPREDGPGGLVSHYRFAKVDKTGKNAQLVYTRPGCS